MHKQTLNKENKKKSSLFSSIWLFSEKEVNFHIMKTRLILIVTFSLLVGYCSVFANTYHVLKTGQDANDGSKESQNPESSEAGTAIDGFYYIDAEDFDDYGGWQVDNQFVHIMGSPYLIAAGVGTPVKDAATTINILKSGQYHVWVRDRNWEQEFAPGRFRVLVNGTPLKMEFGAAPFDNWTWEYGGKVKLKKGSVDLALHDLTGFYGRCDAIILTKDANYIPPEEKDEVCEERARLKGLSLEPSFMGEYDVIVVGGGSAGVPAAIAAARMGAKTALIQNRPVLGGNSSEELGVAIVGAGFNHPGWRETGIIEEAELLRVHDGQSNSSKAFKQLCDAEENLTLFLNQHVFDAIMESDKEIKGVKAVSTVTGKISEYSGKMFIDCTGDGWLGYFSGATHRYGRESKDEFNESLAPDTADHITMSGCLMGGTLYGFGTAFRSRKVSQPVAFFRRPWAREIHDLVGYERRVHQVDAGNWWMEHEGSVDDLFDPERARDELIKVTFSYWDKVAGCEVNFQRHKIHRFDKVSTGKIKIEIKETHGASSARVYEVRVYNK